MRYYVKNDEGQELICPSLADLHALYHQKFLDDNDLVRSENSRTWIRVDSMPALRGVRESQRDPRQMWLLAAAAAVLVLVIVFAFRLFMK